MTQKTDLFPSIERIDKRLILSYGLLIIIIIAVLSLFAGWYYQNIMEQEEKRLSLLSSQILNIAVKRTSFSGKYHTRLFIEEISRQFKDIRLIEIVDKNGRIIGHSNKKKNGQLTDPHIALPVLNKGKPYLFNTICINGEDVVEIILPYHSGYMNQLSGYVRILISREKVNQEIYEGFVYLAILVAGLFIIALFIVRKLSNHFTRPVFFMADVLKGILKNAPVLIAIQDRGGKLLLYSKSYSRYFNRQKNDNHSCALDPGTHFPKTDWNKERVIENLISAPLNQQPRTLRALYFPINLDQNNQPLLMCCIAEDVTERLSIENKLHASERQLKMVLEGAHLGFWDWNIQTGKHQVDQIWMEQLGLEPSDLSFTEEDWKQRIHPDDQEHVALVVQQAIKDKTAYTVEFRMRHKQNYWLWILGSGAVVEWVDDNTPRRLCGTHQDISLRKQHEEELYLHANFDPLTGLPNRNNLKSTLQLLLKNHFKGDLNNTVYDKESSYQVAVMFIDLDNFKIVNDTYGHEIGDLLLQSVSSRIKHAIHESQVLYRFGGDEFVLVINNVDDLDEVSIEAKRIINALKEPFIINQHTFYVGASIGISIFPDDSDNYNLLLRNADTAMYKAKESGRNNFCFYTSQMNKEIQEHMEIASMLQSVLDNDNCNKELYLVYQPQIDVASGEIVSCEALLRWQNPERGNIPPNVFVPIAEKSSLICRLGEWIMDTVCAQRQKWREMGIYHFRVDINLSSRQVSAPNLSKDLHKIMQQYQLKTGDIGLELTESAIVSGDKSVLSNLHNLREAGFDIALDDFGTGYSSLSYIQRFPVSTIKIDRAFIVDIDAQNRTDGTAIVRAIIAMSTSLGLKIVAEGVETREQYEFVKEHHCHYIQGFYFYKPMTSEKLTELLLSRQ